MIAIGSLHWLDGNRVTIGHVVREGHLAEAIYPHEFVVDLDRGNLILAAPTHVRAGGYLCFSQYVPIDPKAFWEAAMKHNWDDWKGEEPIAIEEGRMPDLDALEEARRKSLTKEAEWDEGQGAAGWSGGKWLCWHE